MSKNVVVIAHVSLNELPPTWRARVPVAPDARVTVRIEEEIVEPDEQAAKAVNPMFGMWKDRDDMADVAGHIRQLRGSRGGSDKFGEVSF